MSYTKQVLSGSIYYFTGSVLAAIIAYLTKLVLVRNLSVEDYGLFFAVLTFVLIFSVFRTLGMSQGLARFIADYNSKKKNGEIKSIITGAFATQLLVAGIMVIILWFSADYLALNYFKDARAVTLLRILSFYLPLSIIHVNFTSIFQGLKKSKLFALGQPVINAFVLIGSIIGLWLGLELFAPVIGYLGTYVFFLIVFIFPLLKCFNYFNFKHKNFFEENKKLIIFSLPLMITTFGYLLITYFDTLMLTYFDILSNVGVYNIIYPTALLITFIGSSLGLILLPVITELWEKNKKKQIVTALKIINKYLLIFCLPVIIVLMTFSEDLIRIFFGREYLAGVVAFNILLVGALFNVFMGLYNQLQIALKQQKKVMNIYLVGSIINVILNILLIPKYSLNGAAIASAISFLIMLKLSLVYIEQKIKIEPPWKSWLITSFTSLLIPVVPIILNKYINLNVYVTTISGLILGGLIYLFILYKIKIININEIKKVITR